MIAIKPKPPKSKVLTHAQERLAIRCAEFMELTGLPSLNGPMWHANTLKAIRAKHGQTPAFFNLPKLIGHIYGERALELFNSIMQLKNTIRLLEQLEAQK